MPIDYGLCVFSKAMPDYSCCCIAYAICADTLFKDLYFFEVLQPVNALANSGPQATSHL